MICLQIQLSPVVAMGLDADREHGHLVKTLYKCNDEFLPQNEDMDLKTEELPRIHIVKALYVCQDTLGDSASNERKCKSSVNSSICAKSEQLSHLQTYTKCHTLEFPTKCDQKKYTCETCNKLFTQASNMRRHKLSVHRNKRPFSCTICTKSFKQLSNLQVHIDVHTGKKPYCCNKCSQFFNQASNLKRHKLATHSNRRPHVCKVCSKSFKQKNHLKEHMLVHTGEKPFQCDQCNKIFTQAFNLKRHKLCAHSDMRPHKCMLCSKSFRQADHLKRHMNVHTGEKPFKCDQCRKIFSQAFNLRRHTLTHSKIYHKVPVDSDLWPQRHRLSGSVGRRPEVGRDYPAPPPPGVPHYALLREREERARAEVRGGLSTSSKSVDLETRGKVDGKARKEKTLEEKLLHLNM